MQVDAVNPLISGLVETFEKMLNIDLQVGKLNLTHKKEFSCKLNAIVAYNDGATGIVCLGFGTRTAAAVVTALLQEDVKDDLDMVEDGISELVSIITGYAKKDLMGKKMKLGLPEIRGNDDPCPYEFLPVVVVPFSFNEFEFQMDISMPKLEC
jgi:CheY-specific phosphatase CheX